MMTKSEIVDYLSFDNTGGRKTNKKNFIKNFPEEYLAIITFNNIHHPNNNFIWKQSIYNYTHDIIKIPKCKNIGCENNLNFHRIKNKYHNYCSNKCQIIGESENKRLTCIKKYGHENPMKSNIVKENLNIANQTKYNKDRYFLSDNYLIKLKKNNLIKTTKIYANKLKINIDSITITENNDLKIKDYCEKHNEFIISKNNLRNRLLYNVNICTECHPIDNHDSIGQDEIKLYIENNLNFKTEKLKINKKEIDVYISDHRIGIEYNGLYWHSKKYKKKSYHLEKTNLCENNNIQLIHIFEDEWLYKREIIKNIIRNKLNLNNNISENNLKIIEIDLPTSNDFLIKNHINGEISSEIRFGLMLDDELVSLIVLNRSTNNGYELIRFCDKINYSIFNGFNKLLNHFIETYKPKTITTLIDRRFDQGLFLKSIGFQFIENLEPNCWSYNKNENGVYYRYIENKHITNNTITNQIYDCGETRFMLNL